ncbi:MAG TPA: ABC transporter ATP-binding protein [bacterium]|nr:ABC transporter ATP-binding protein [bacterium]
MKLELQDLTLAYGEVVALREVSVCLEGRVLGVLGANASGKTSMLKVLAGILRATEGRVLLDGEEISQGKKAWISYLPQETGFFPFFQQPRQTLSASLMLRGIVNPDAPGVLLAALGLEEDERSAEGFSGGMKQKLRIAQALIHAPRVLLLDEPTVGLDARERYRILRLIDRLRDRVSVIFATHQPDDAAAVSDELLVLHHGRVVAFGRPAELIARAEGWVFEVSVTSPTLPEDPRYEIVRAERRGTNLRLRVVGEAPQGAREVSPNMEDAYTLLTWHRREYH